MAGLPAGQETTIRRACRPRALRPRAHGVRHGRAGAGRPRLCRASRRQGLRRGHAFSQADGFFAIESLADAMPAGATAEVTSFRPMSACPTSSSWAATARSRRGRLGPLAAGTHEPHPRARQPRAGSRPWSAANAMSRRSICSTRDGRLQTAFPRRETLDDQGLAPAQGLVFRRGDPRFEGRNLEQAVIAALADNACLMVNRNAGAGTRTLIDRLLKGAKPPGYWNQPRSHNAVALRSRRGARLGRGDPARRRDARPRLHPPRDEEYDFAVRAGFAGKRQGHGFPCGIADRAEAIAALGFERPSCTPYRGAGARRRAPPAPRRARAARRASSIRSRRCWRASPGRPAPSRS